MKYKIIFDSNSVWLDKESDLTVIFNSDVSNLNSFIKSNKLQEDVSLLIPEVVLQERLTQRQNNVVTAMDNVENKLKNLEEAGVSSTITKVSKEEIRKKLDEKARNFLDVESISILVVPQLKQEVLLERAYKRIKPFGKEDKGFKDTLIWLSILADTENNSDDTTYVLCTRNKEDFEDSILKEELINHSDKSKLHLCTSIQEIKEYLDKELVLKLALRELNTKIEDAVRQRLGEIMVQFHQNIGNSKSFVSSSVTSPWSSYTAASTMSFGASSVFGTEEKTIVGYDFIKIKFQNIFEIAPNNYRISAILTVRPRYDTENSFNTFTIYRSSPLREDKEYSIDFQYDTTHKTILMLSVRSGLSWG